MFILIFSEPVYRYWFVRQDHNYLKETGRLDSLMANMKWSNDSVHVPDKIQPTSKQLFAFDPNQSSKEELMELGFSSAIANRVVTYRSKGGKFFIKHDLMKIYGMDSVFYKKLNPLISLPEIIVRVNPKRMEEGSEKRTSLKFDINKADTSQLIRIYGIGKKLSVRIIAYREKLGGFISLTQLKEVYGLDSVVVNELSAKSFIENDFAPVKIDVNAGTEKELGAHPYIKYKLAKAIVAYRIQHGPFKSLDELKKIAIMDEATYLKLRPYLTQAGKP